MTLPLDRHAFLPYPFSGVMSSLPKSKQPRSLISFHARVCSLSVLNSLLNLAFQEYLQRVEKEVRNVTQQFCQFQSFQILRCKTTELVAMLQRLLSTNSSSRNRKSRQSWPRCARSRVAAILPPFRACFVIGFTPVGRQIPWRN